MPSRCRSCKDAGELEAMDELLEKLRARGRSVAVAGRPQ